MKLVAKYNLIVHMNDEIEEICDAEVSNSASNFRVKAIEKTIFIKTRIFTFL